MKVIFKVSLVALLLNTINLTASTVVATVNGEAITQKDVNEFVIASIPGATFSHLNEIQKKSVIKQMIERKLFLENAKELHIEKNPEFIVALNKVRDNLMLDYWMKEKVEEIVISEKDAKAYYQSHLSKFNRAASVKVRHILLATKAEAIGIIRQLEKSKALKKKFIALAKSKSTGPSSVNGGELDWFVQEQMVPEFSDAAFALKEGSITKEPVKTQFGYHVIYLEKKKEKGVIPFEKVKADIVKALRVEQFKSKLDKLSKKLKKTADISVK
jgi:parvulin-like peptidyl-prolyl isomerase